VMVQESEDRMELEFDLVGVPAAFANALRRILLAEVPSMAIEKVYLYQNTSVIPDEVLCHRFGLLPIKANPDDFNFPPTVGVSSAFMTDEDKEAANDNFTEEPAGDPDVNLVFEIKVKCERKKDAVGKAPKEGWEEYYNHATVLSSAMRWSPVGDQVSRPNFKRSPPTVVSDGVILAKMRPGMEIEARCHCVKGVGRDHAKFSPVATAWYRLMPVINLKREISGEAAIRLKDSFSPGVIEIDEKSGVAYVENARADSSSRNVYRHADLRDAVEMSKLREHFIFTIESVGVVEARKLFVDAAEIMREKVGSLRSQLEEMLSSAQ